jgi:DsbC/DsbD-like thiol-disulfide interchange protein
MVCRVERDMRLTVCLAMLLLPCVALAAPKPELVKAELLADVTAIKAGEPFKIGVMLHITPGWHIYWINPGDSGMATSVHLKLPPGFTVSPIQFPVPDRLEQPGHVVNFGYEGHVLLMATVTPPPDLKGVKDANLVADVRFLCCKDICMPGSATAQLTLSTSSQVTPANETTFRQWEAQLPATNSADMIESNISIKPDGAGKIAIDWKHLPGHIEIFPGPGDAIAVSDMSIQNTNNTTDITFHINRLAGLETSESRYPIVIGYTDGNGNHRGLTVDIAMSAIRVAGQKQ